MNKVRVAATELQQLLKQNTNIFAEATAQKPLSDFVQLQSLLKNEVVGRRGGTCPSAP